jgi:PelA/Pel-15E family pectate lyase
VAMVSFLMELEKPSAAIIEAVHDAVAWYEATKITGKSWERGAAALTDDAQAQPMWSRFYELGTNRPIFGDRDGTVHYDIGQISAERREGYGWYTTAPNKILKRYQQWAKQYPGKI